MNILPITVTILTKNSEKYLNEILDRLDIFDEVLILDNGSNDETLNIAKKYANVRIIEHDFEGFGFMKNLAASKAKNMWIFNIDSDEIISSELLCSLQNIDLSQENRIYTISRLNHYRGRPIRGCGWYPDIIPRLYHKKYTDFSSLAVHERIKIPKNSQIYRLKGDLLHYSYSGAHQLIEKMQHYSDLYAFENINKKQSSVFKALMHGAMALVKSYILKRGFLYGSDGIIISIANAMNSYYKYIKLYELNRTQRKIDKIGLSEKCMKNTTLLKNKQNL